MPDHSFASPGSFTDTMGDSSSITGSNGNDTVYAGDKSDTIEGYGGSDALYGGDDDDVVRGGAGNDTVQGGQGSDSVYGGDANDHVAGNTGSDYVNGGAGNDFVFGDSGDDVVFGDGGNDYIETNEGHDRFADGGAGYDFVSFTFLRDVSASVSDFQTAGSGISDIGFAGATGGADGDILRGVGLVGFLAGGDGNDLIDGSAANSNSILVGVINVDGHDIPAASVWLMGGRGNDILIGGAKNNVFFGGHDVELNSYLMGSTDISRWMDGWGAGSINDSASIVTGQNPEMASSYCDVFVIGSNFTYNSGVTYAENYTDTIFDFQHKYDYLDFSYVDFTTSELLQDKVSVTRNGKTFDLGISYNSITSSADIHFLDGNGNNRIVKLIGKSVSEIRNNADRIFDIDGDTVIGAVSVNTADDIFGLGGGKTVDEVDNLVLSSSGYLQSDAITSWETDTWNTSKDSYISDSGVDISKNNHIMATGDGSKSNGKPQSLGVRHDLYFDGSDSTSSLQHNIAGNDGQDIIVGRGGNDSLHGDDQVDLLLGGGGSDNLEGNRGDDFLIGQSGADLVLGGFGNDLIDGGSEGDTIDGDFGNDVIYGNSGNDKIDGGAGDDVIYGDSFLDAMTASSGIVSKLFTWFDASGSSTVIYFIGSDIIINFYDGVTVFADVYGFSFSGTVSGNDTLFGGYGNDTLHSSGGTDRLMGGQGNDSLSSYGGTDTLRGGSGNDVLQGGDGSDILSGDHGNDSLTGGNGTDSLSGGYGTDVFQFSGVAETAVGTGRDAVLDFLSGADDIDLGAIDANSALAGNQAFLFNATTARANAIWYVVSGTDVIVKGDVNGNTTADFEIALKGVSALVAGDFLL